MGLTKCLDLAWFSNVHLELRPVGMSAKTNTLTEFSPSGVELH
jgi:hypothetical protein